MCHLVVGEAYDRSVSLLMMWSPVIEGLVESEWSSRIIHPLAQRALPGVLSTLSFAIAAPDGGRLDVYQHTA